MKWVVPSESNADVRELLDTHGRGLYKVVLELGSTAETAETTRRHIGANVAFHAREINALFRLLQQHRKKEQTEPWVVVFYPRGAFPVSKAYNRVLKDPELRVVVVSHLKGVVRDNRLTAFSGFVDVPAEAPPAETPAYWVASWLF